MTIGEKIADLRRVNKMTQRDLAEIINVSDKVISKWETGRTLPDVEAMLRLSKTFNVSISDLFECIEKTDTQKAEEYNEERIWQYKKYSIISYILIIVSQIVIFIFSASTYIDEFGFFILLIALASIFLSVGFQITQFVRLYSYAKDKHNKTEYINILKKYGIIYLFIFGSILTIWILLYISVIS